MNLLRQQARAKRLQARRLRMKTALSSNAVYLTYKRMNDDTQAFLDNLRDTVAGTPLDQLVVDVVHAYREYADKLIELVEAMEKTEP